MVRTTLTQPSNTDIREYDIGNFTFAAEGCANNTSQIGQLWVHYDVTLYNPKLPSTGSEYISVQASDVKSSFSFLTPSGFNVGYGNPIVRLPPTMPGMVGDPSVGAPATPQVFTLNDSSSTLTFQTPGVYEAVLTGSIPNWSFIETKLTPNWLTSIGTAGCSLLEEIGSCIGPVWNQSSISNDFGYVMTRFLVTALVSGAQLFVDFADAFNIYRKFSLKSYSPGPSGPIEWYFPQGVKLYYCDRSREAAARMVRQGLVKESSYRKFLDYCNSPLNVNCLLDRKERKVVPSALNEPQADCRDDSVTSEGEDGEIVVLNSRNRRVVVQPTSSERRPGSSGSRSKSVDPKE